MKGKFSENIKKIFSEIIRGVKLELGIHPKKSGLYMSCIFYFCQIRTQVAMSTYSMLRIVL